MRHASNTQSANQTLTLFFAAVLAVFGLMAALARTPNGMSQAAVSELQEQVERKADQTEFEALRLRVVEHSDQLASVNGRMDETDALVKNHGNILEGIAQVKDGAHVPRVEANMDVPAFQEELARVVNQHAIKPQSIVTIRNATQRPQTVFVGYDDARGYHLMPGATTGDLAVATGNVATRLAEQEWVNWSVGPPKYRLELRILDDGADAQPTAP